MKYIDENDLAQVIQERFLDESTANIAGNSDILDGIESKAIEYVISYITGRYKTDLIFAETTPLASGILKQIIAQIVVYRAVKRNAARKVPEDYVTLMSDATKQLERIQSGAMSLVSIPLQTDASGNTMPVLFGNTTDENKFI
jgi:Protein of unknown function (DUF1320).